MKLLFRLFKRSKVTDDPCVCVRACASFRAEEVNGIMVNLDKANQVRLRPQPYVLH